MRKLAILGPKGTYSEMAAKKLIDSYDLQYGKTLLETLLMINEDCDALVPIENTLDGFVMESLDAIIKFDLRIYNQVKLAIDFNYVSYQKDVQKVYVQFKTYGQCQDFILQNHLEPIITQSNMESLELLNKNPNAKVGAIIPTHIDVTSFPHIIRNVIDSKPNETRFVLVKKNNKDYMKYGMASVAIFPQRDEPGVLYSILSRFHRYGINLKAILSRPTRDILGKYIFYIECELNEEDRDSLISLKEELKKNQEAECKILGIYQRL